jgi:hypothetical protein
MLNDVDDWLQEFAGWNLLLVLLTGLFLKAQVAISGDSFDKSIANGLLMFMTVMTGLIMLLMIFLVLGGMEDKVRSSTMCGYYVCMSGSVSCEFLHCDPACTTANDKVRAFLANRKAKKAQKKAEKASRAKGKEKTASSPAASAWDHPKKSAVSSSSKSKKGNQVAPAPPSNPAMEAKGNFAAAEAQMEIVLQPPAAAADQLSMFEEKQSEVSAPVPPSM